MTKIEANQANLRSEEEVAIAHQELSDVFYPRKVYGGPCEECRFIDEHWTTCPVGKTRFQGWVTTIHKTKLPSGTCDANHCTYTASMRIRLNIHGCLHEFDVCREHGTYLQYGKPVSRDGTRCDSL